MVNAEWYVNLCPSKVFEAWSARRPNNGTRGLLPHHDNVSAHTAATALNYLEANRVQLVTQTPVFPGFSPLWFLFAPSSEAAVEGEAVSGRRRCSSRFRGRDF